MTAQKKDETPPAPAAAEPAEVVGTQLITLDPEKYVTAVFASFRDQLEAAKSEALAVQVVDVTTPDGMKSAIKHRAAFRVIRVEAEKARKVRKAPILEIGRLLDSRYKDLEAEIAPLEDRFDSAIKAEESRKENERLARERAETERIARIEASIKEIRDVIIDVVGRPAAVIAEQLEAIRAIEPTPERYFEFHEAAAIAKRDTILKLEDMHRAQSAAEAEAARIKAEREELARLRAAEDQRLREQAAREAEATRQRAEEEAQARRKMEDEQRAHRSRMEAEERAAREAREAEAVKLKAVQDRIDAERRALEEKQRQEREAIEAKERAEREAREEAERQERLAVEAREREERLAQEKAEREERWRESERTDIRETLGRLRERAVGVAEFAWFVKAYDAAMAPPKERKRRAAASAA